VPFTSDEHVSGVEVEARLGGDAQGVEALVLLVQVAQGEGGPLAAPLEVHPLGRLQGHGWTQRGTAKWFFL